MPYNMDDLAILEIVDRDAFENLTAEQQKQAIRNQYIKLIYKYHPDKNSNTDNENIRKIIEAYKALNRGVALTPQPDNSESHVPPVDIPKTAFDLLLQEGIYEAYQALLRERNQIDNQDEKIAFDAYYETFFNLAKSLELVEPSLVQERAKSLEEKENASLKTILIQGLRELIVRLFAEEYLNDFQYRHALATGELYAILATRKLFSPIKWIVAALNLINLIICSSAAYLFEGLKKDCFQQYSADRLDWEKLAAIILKITIILTCLYFAFTPCILAVGLPFVASLCEALASPVNQIIRPLAAYLKLRPSILMFGALAIVGASSAYGFFAVSVVRALMSLLPYLTIALYFYTLYGTADYLRKIYKVAPFLALFFGGYCVTSTLILWLCSPILASFFTGGFYSILAVFFQNASLAIIIFKSNQMLDDPKAAILSQLENLPLPEEPVPESIQKATLIGYQNANQSHRFFNTPKHARNLSDSERTIKYQLSSFFGEGDQPPVRFVRPANVHREAPGESSDLLSIMAA